MMIKQLDIDIKTVVNPSLIRPNDNKIIIGSNEKLKSATGWTTTYSLEISLNDILNYWYTSIKN